MIQRKHLMAPAIGLALAGGSAHAVDIRDPLPDSLSLGGVTVYATIDVGYAYQSHGVPISASLPGGLEYQSFTTTRNFGGSVSTAAESGLEQSKIGIRVSEPIAGDFTLVGRAETGFNPLSGQLVDACASMAQNAGKKQGQQTANADSSRCGQAFNSQLFAGASSPTAGTLTIGRHNSLQLDALATYDPQALSYAFSFLGYSGFNGGAGSTQGARYDNSVRYALATGPVHIGAIYSTGGQDTGIFGKAWGAQAGLVLGGLSLDAVYENEKGVVNLRSSFNDPGPVVPAGLPTTLAADFPAASAYPLSAYVSDNTSYNFMGKYTFAFGDAAHADKLMLFAGYTHIQKSHADYNGGSAEGSYAIAVPINVNAPAEYNMEWTGLRYAQSTGLNFVAAYYHITQNSWTVGEKTNGVSNIGCSKAGLICAGAFEEASFVTDYVVNKHYDVYGGVNWSEVTDGLASGFPGTPSKNAFSGSENQVTLMFGLRIRI